MSCLTKKHACISCSCLLIQIQQNPITTAIQRALVKLPMKLFPRHLAKNSMTIIGAALIALMPIHSYGAGGEEAAQKRQAERRELLRELDRNAQITKERALDLEHALYKLEIDQKMHPLSETRWFFAIQTKKNYTIQKLRVEVDGKPFVELEYHRSEADALSNDGADRIFHGNLAAGSHSVKAYVDGYFEEDDKILDYSTAASFELEKTRGLSHLLLALEDTKNTWEPALRLQAWQQ